MTKWNWDVMNEQQRIKAVQHEIGLYTHNGTRKEDLVNMLRWLWSKFEVENKQMCEKAITNHGRCLGYQRSVDDDEPTERCKGCVKHIAYDEDALD